MAFPTLSVLPNFPMKITREDFTMRSSSEGGIVKTRARYTKARKTFFPQYENLPAADRTLLEAHLDSMNGGADSFTWTDPVTTTTYTVRYGAPLPEFEVTSHDGDKYLYSTNITLIEV